MSISMVKNAATTRYTFGDIYAAARTVLAQGWTEACTGTDAGHRFTRADGATVNVGLGANLMMVSADRPTGHSSRQISIDWKAPLGDLGAHIARHVNAVAREADATVTDFDLDNLGAATAQILGREWGPAAASDGNAVRLTHGDRTITADIVANPDGDLEVTVFNGDRWETTTLDIPEGDSLNMTAARIVAEIICLRMDVTA